MRRLITILMIMIAGLLTGCATMFGNHDRQVAVNSTPPGASVYVNTNYQGTTPTTVVLRNLSKTNVIQVQKHGYKAMVLPVKTKFQAVGLWDIFLWPTFFIDYLTGNTNRIAADSRTLHFNLVPQH